MFRIQNDQDYNKIYFNASIRNDTDDFYKQASLDITRNQPFINNPSEYYLTISRFNIDASIMPLLIFTVVDNQPNPNLGNTKFTLRHTPSGTNFEQNLIYIPSTTNIPVPPAPIPKMDRTNPYYYVYTYNIMIEMMNTALQTAFNNLKAAFPAISHTEAPYLKYDKDTELISLIVQYDYFSSNDVEIYANKNLQRFLEGIRVNVNLNDSNNLFARFIINRINDNAYAKPGATIPTPPNNPDYLIMDGEYSTISLWPSFKEILFTTESLPIRLEYVQNADDSGKNIQKPIITDFSPLIENAGEQRSIFRYFANGSYRLINLNNSSPLYRFDFKIWWVDNLDVIHPLYLRKGIKSDIKIAFFKKKTFTG